MKIFRNSPNQPSTKGGRKKSGGFSLLEILIVIAAISSVGAMAFVALSGSSTSVKDAKLQQDVAALNRAIKTYLMSGGNLDNVTSGTAAIAKLKTVAAASQRPTMAGLRNSMVDLRLRGVSSSGNGTLRAVWDTNKRSFIVTDTGTGFREFVLDNAAVPATPVEETRTQLASMNSVDNWIWGFNDQNAVAAAPRTAAVSTAAPVITAAAAESMTVLQAPDFSKPGALYDYSAFDPDLEVSLVDRNAANTAESYYSIGGGPWQRYNGTPLSIPRALFTQVRAYSAPLDPDHYEQSEVATANYETIYFSGSSSGLFKNPLGDAGLVTNLLSGLTNLLFTWGSPAILSGFTKPNSLTFTGKSFSSVAPEELFEIGTLTYYNGSTYAGTNALSVVFNLKLNLTTPSAIEDLPFLFNLLSTTNTKAEKKNDWRNNESEKQMDDADADYVYIPDVSTGFNTTVKGQKFYLVLSFGSNSSDGFTTIDEFHTHESKTMTGVIYGRFTTNPNSTGVAGLKDSLTDSNSGSGND